MVSKSGGSGCIGKVTLGIDACGPDIRRGAATSTSRTPTYTEETGTAAGVYTFTAGEGVTKVVYAIVAGGGGGGSSSPTWPTFEMGACSIKYAIGGPGGGGGGGQVKIGHLPVIEGGKITITVGAGGCLGTGNGVGSATSIAVCCAYTGGGLIIAKGGGPGGNGFVGWPVDFSYGNKSRVYCITRFFNYRELCLIGMGGHGGYSWHMSNSTIYPRYRTSEGEGTNIINFGMRYKESCEPYVRCCGFGGCCWMKTGCKSSLLKNFIPAYNGIYSASNTYRNKWAKFYGYFGGQFAGCRCSFRNYINCADLATANIQWYRASSDIARYGYRLGTVGTYNYYDTYYVASFGGAGTQTESGFRVPRCDNNIDYNCITVNRYLTTTSNATEIAKIDLRNCQGFAPSPWRYCGGCYNRCPNCFRHIGRRTVTNANRGTTYNLNAGTALSLGGQGIEGLRYQTNYFSDKTCPNLWPAYQKLDIDCWGAGGQGSETAFVASGSTSTFKYLETVPGGGGRGTSYNSTSKTYRSATRGNPGGFHIVMQEKRNLNVANELGCNASILKYRTSGTEISISDPNVQILADTTEAVSQTDLSEFYGKCYWKQYGIIPNYTPATPPGPTPPGPTPPAATVPLTSIMWGGGGGGGWPRIRPCSNVPFLDSGGGGGGGELPGYSSVLETTFGSGKIINIRPTSGLQYPVYVAAGRSGSVTMPSSTCSPPICSQADPYLTKIVCSNGSTVVGSARSGNSGYRYLCNNYNNGGAAGCGKVNIRRPSDMWGTGFGKTFNSGGRFGGGGGGTGELSENLPHRPYYDHVTGGYGGLGIKICIPTSSGTFTPRWIGGGGGGGSVYGGGVNQTGLVEDRGLSNKGKCSFAVGGIGAYINKARTAVIRTNIDGAPNTGQGGGGGAQSQLPNPNLTKTCVIGPHYRGLRRDVKYNSVFSSPYFCYAKGTIPFVITDFMWGYMYYIAKELCSSSLSGSGTANIAVGTGFQSAAYGGNGGSGGAIFKYSLDRSKTPSGQLFDVTGTGNYTTIISCVAYHVFVTSGFLVGKV